MPTPRPWAEGEADGAKSSACEGRCDRARLAEPNAGKVAMTAESDFFSSLKVNAAAARRFRAIGIILLTVT
jgi:hypothetical protein